MVRINNKFTPKQPYFVMATECYYKYIVMKYGISHFYSFTPIRNIDNVVTIVPDGCVDIIFRCGIDEPDSFIYGTVLKCGTSKFIKGQHYFGVRFLPGQALLPGNMPIADLVESGINLWDVMKDKKVIENITRTVDFNYQINAFMKVYLKDYYNVKKNSLNNYINNFILDEIIKNGGNVKIELLSDKCGYSSRYINKVFSNEFGISPKLFCRLMRFQNFIYSLNDKDNKEDIVNIAMDSGYYDQSHLTKDFHVFANTTPKRYLNEIKENSYENRIIII